MGKKKRRELEEILRRKLKAGKKGKREKTKAPENAAVSPEIMASGNFSVYAGSSSVRNQSAEKRTERVTGILDRIRICLKRYDRVFEFLEFLLKNAIVLEKFVIISRRRKCWLGRENCMSIYSRRLAKKLSDCPRSLTIIMPSFHESVDHN
nr:uncharacterized protein LOC117273152 [Nicotiana tomentosiformis]